MSPESQERSNFGARVRLAREAMGLRRRSLAAEAGISRSTLCNIETSRHTVSLLSALLIVQAIAKRDPSRAVWVCEAPDARREVKRLLAASRRGPLPRPPLSAQLWATRRGQQVCLGVAADRHVLAKIVERVRQWLADPNAPDAQILAVTLSFDDPDPSE